MRYLNLEDYLLGDDFIEGVEKDIPSIFKDRLSKADYALLVSSIFANNAWNIEILSLSNGLLRYQECFTYYDINTNRYYDDEPDDRIREADTNAIIEEALSVENPNIENIADTISYVGYWHRMETPLLKYLKTDYDVARTYLRIGWHDNLYKTTDGEWWAPDSNMKREFFHRKMFSEFYASPFIQLEGRRSVSVHNSYLAEWGISEETLWEDALYGASSLRKEEIVIQQDPFLEAFSITCSIVSHSSQEVPSLMYSLRDWAPQLIGVLGALVIMPSAYIGMVYTINEAPQFHIGVSSILTYGRKYYDKLYSMHYLFRERVFWYYEGQLMEVPFEEIEKDGEKQVELKLQGTMEKLFGIDSMDL